MSCSNVTDCENCTARSWCHFCAADKQCHAYGSPYGCSVGISCSDLKTCVRSEPQFKGYGDPPPVPAAIIICVALIFILLLCCCAWRARRKKTQVRAVIDDSLASRDFLELDQMDGTGEVTGAPKLKPRRKLALGVCLLVTGGAVLIAMTCALLFFPRVPAYTLCSRSVDWTGILKGLAAGGVNADVDMLFSVHNPNRFQVDVSSASATFYWKGITIGTGALGSTRFPSGSIVDFTLKTRFTPGISTASQMLAAHYVGTLLLDVDLALETSVDFFERWTYDLQTNHTASNIDVSAVVSRELCLCP